MMAETLCTGEQVVVGEMAMLQPGRKMEREREGNICSGSEMSKAEKEGDPCSGKKEGSFRAEIDTSAPFESVKEAVSRFGGVGYWKPSHNKLPETEQGNTEEVDIPKLKEQAAYMEKDLILKERETLEVLKELESTKLIIEEMKLKMQKEEPEVRLTLETNSDYKDSTPADKEADKENQRHLDCKSKNSVEGLSSCPSSSPGLILMELKQAKLNLTRTTSNIADIRASVESFNKKLESERISLEKTRERLTQNSSKISSLEEELNQTSLKLRVFKEAEAKGGGSNPLDISKDLQRLNAEVEQFKKMGEAAKSEVLKTISEIEHTKARIKTADIRLVAARKMKEAARAAEAVALAEIKVLSNHETPSGGVTLSCEEYSSLTCKAQEAEELSKRKVREAMKHVDEANVSQTDILKRIEEATEEVRTSKKALEVALNRVEAANNGKLAVEEALRKWRSEHGQKRRSVLSSTKFKNSSCPVNHRRESHLLDVNGLNLVTDISSPVLKPTLSIGQILSRKLLLPEEFDSAILAEKSAMKRKVSLGQMLSKQNGDLPCSHSKVEIGCIGGQKQFVGKKKKYGFARFSLLLAKQNKKKKKPAANKK